MKKSLTGEETWAVVGFANVCKWIILQSESKSETNKGEKEGNAWRQLPAVSWQFLLQKCFVSCTIFFFTTASTQLSHAPQYDIPSTSPSATFTPGIKISFFKMCDLKVLYHMHLHLMLTVVPSVHINIQLLSMLAPSDQLRNCSSSTASIALYIIQFCVDTMVRSDTSHHCLSNSFNHVLLLCCFFFHFTVFQCQLLTGRK